MTGNLIGKILYQKRRFIIGWFVGMFALAVLMMLFFPALKHSDVGQFFANMSPAVQKALGGQDSFSRVDNYISSELFALRMPLLFIILSVILFGSLTVGDERRGILMTQLSLPFSRTRLLSLKLVAGLLIHLIAALGMILGIVVGLALIHESYSLVEILKHVTGCLLIGLDFGLVVFVFGGGFGWKSGATGIASAVAFLSYLISSLTPIITGLSSVEKLSLFHYYQNPSPASLYHVGLLVVVALILMVAGIIGFQRRDVS
jgi:putative exporter of polyketide antibiotics